MRVQTFALIVLAKMLAGCSTLVVKFDHDTAAPYDADLDGFGEEDGDCDDNASLVNPGAADTCNDGIDQDCDGADAACPDMDGDGFTADDGDCDDSDAALTPEDADNDGVSSCDGDCDDADPAFYPGAVETCDDPTDYNCDGSVAYADADRDGTPACEDCDDNDRGAYPGATETWYDGVDSDCLGDSDYDADADGYDSANFGFDDCDDLSATAYPGAPETCNDADDDCNGVVDDGPGDSWFVDSDGDGYGDAASVEVIACDGPAGYVRNALDCDDAAAAVNPLAVEACNGVDDDCDGTVPATEVDADSDGSFACDDCDDADPDVSPLAEEVCGDGIDNNCESADDASGDTYYADTDGDGYGDAADTVTQCGAPAGYVLSDTDCDDADSAVSPGALEVCGGADEDCDGTTDENDASDASAWYADSDADGYGDSAVRYLACEQPAGYVAGADDCDDAASGVNPGADEVCDGITDEDCDGSVDEGVTARFYADGDGDTWGSPGTWTEACAAPSGYVTDNTDCDDADAAANNDDLDGDGDSTCDEDCDDLDADLNRDDMDGDGYDSCEGECNDSEPDIHPGTVEVCDGSDNDCNGSPDDGLTFRNYYRDGDSDDYGDAGTTIYQCEQPAAYVEDDTDCDDADHEVNPGAAETCDGEDDDCDGTADNGFDADADGAYDAASCSYGTDCDDADAAVAPGATEACNGEDDDCDGAVDEDYDADGDGYASAAACSYGTDCDDAEIAVSPDGKEISLTSTAIDDLCSDGLDNDCDGFADALDPWDCGDEDADGIENGIDVLVAMDSDADGLDDTLCLIADERLSMASPWDTYDAVIQGDGWGAFSVLDAASYTEPLVAWADSDGDGADDVYAWCNTFAGSGLASGAWNWRFVSAVAADESSAATRACSTASDATTWETMDISDACNITGDDWCRAGYAAYDGCGEYIGTVIRTRYSTATESIEVY